MHRPFRFLPPPLPPVAVLRPRLLGLLGRRFDARLVTVEAGAGLGKTTLLAQAVAENRLAPGGRDCWITCEPGDSSASTLLAALLEATGAPEPEGPPRVEQVAESVWASSPEQVCLVLDDAHHLEAGSTGAGALLDLLEALPENGHLVVAARALPELPRARLLVHGRALELTAQELRLDDVETSALAAHHGVDANVVREAGGWVIKTDRL